MDKTFGYGPEDIGSIPIQSVMSTVDMMGVIKLSCRFFPEQI